MTIRKAVTLALLVGIAASTGGCFTGWQQARFTRDVEVAFAVPQSAGLHAESRNGAITITEAPVGEVEVDARIRATTQERADAVQIVAEESGGWLVVTAVWPEGRRGSEGVSFEIVAPGGRPVRADTGNGAVSVNGFVGGAKIDTSNGAIRIEGHDGPLDLRTSNGRITVLDATGEVEADTSNGSISVELADSGTGPVHLDTSNGGVRLVVGPAFNGTISADTSNGRVNVGSYSGSASLLHDSKTHKVLKIGSGESESSIDTSNGSVTIESRG